MLLNPFWVLLLIYFISNFASWLKMVRGEAVLIDSFPYFFEERYFNESFLLLCICLGLLVLFYLNSQKFPKADLWFGNMFGQVLLVSQLSFFIFNQWFDINKAGVWNAPGAPEWIRLFFAALQPDLLFLIIGIGLKSNILFWINALIFNASLLSRGWIGGAMLFGTILSIRYYPVRIDRKKLLVLGGIFILGLLILPYGISAKWFFRAGRSFSEAVQWVNNVGYFEYMRDSLAYVSNRFQMLGHVSLIHENDEYLNEAFSRGEFISPWMDGAPQWLTQKGQGITEIITLNKYMVRELFNSDNPAYATNPGLPGWLFILKDKSGFLIMYLFATVFLIMRVIGKIAGRKYFFLIATFSLIYLFHGWFGAYFNLALYTLIIVGIGYFKARTEKVSGAS